MSLHQRLKIRRYARLLVTFVPHRSRTTYSPPNHDWISWMRAVWLDASAARRGQASAAGTIGFGGVPDEVWDYHIGAYQICHKWLSDRKGRKLSADEIAHYQKIVVARVVPHPFIDPSAFLGLSLVVLGNRINCCPIAVAAGKLVLRLRCLAFGGEWRRPPSSALSFRTSAMAVGAPVVTRPRPGYSLRTFTASLSGEGLGPNLGFAGSLGRDHGCSEMTLLAEEGGGLQDELGVQLTPASS